MTRLHDLYDIGGQSPWLDNLRRDWLEDGHAGQARLDGGAGDHLQPHHSSPTPSAGRTPMTPSSKR